MNDNTLDTDNPQIEYSVIPAHDPGKADEGTLALDRFLAELTTHEVSEHKAGSGWVPGVFSGPRRTILNAERITCLVGDIDGTGPDIDEAAELLGMSGLKSALATSYRHGIDGKHKYRVIIPLVQPLEVPQGDQIAFNEVFKRAQALALHFYGFEKPDTASLGLEHFFYEPRCPAEPGLPPLGQVFEGELLDFTPFMEQAERELATDATGTRKAASNGAARPCESAGLHVRAGYSQDVIDPLTGDKIPLDVWLGKYREGLQMHTMIAAAVKAERWPGVPVKSTTNAKHVICCPNADSHTPQQGPDKGAIAWNASDFAQTGMQGNQRGGLQCSHAHCADDYGADSPGHTGTDDLKLLALALEQGLLNPTDFSDKANYTPEILLKVSGKADAARNKPRQKWRTDTAPDLMPDDYKEAMRWLGERFFVVNGGIGSFIRTKRGLALSLVKKESFFLTYPKKITRDDKRYDVARRWIGAGYYQSFTHTGMWPVGEAPAGGLNLWHGLAVEPDGAKSWAILRKHTETIICEGDPQLFRWLMAWLAAKAQKPTRRSETAIVITGPKGAGKSLFVSAIMQIFGGVGLTTARQQDLVGNFNSALETCVMVHAEEAVFAGDKRAQAEIKSKITDPTLTINRKHFDVKEVENHLSFIFTSNDLRVVQVTPDERRYLALQASNEKTGNRAYFDALVKEINAGAVQGMLHDLLRLDVKAFCQQHNIDLRQPPWTESLTTQAPQGLPVEWQWWIETLTTGTPYPFAGDYQNPTDKDALEWGTLPHFWSAELLYAGYTKYFDKAGEYRRGNYMGLVAFAKFIKNGHGDAFTPHTIRPQGAQVTGEDKTSDGYVLRTKTCPRGYDFPPLGDMRRITQSTIAENSGFAETAGLFDFGGENDTE